MDPRDQLRPLLDGVGCTVCGSPVPAERIRILAHRDDLAFVELDCPGCGSTTLAMLEAADDPEGGLIREAPTFGELTPAEEARRLGSGPITAADVRAARAFLAGWEGDLVGLLGRDEADGRREPPASR
jgi:hypothetical protein